jgi:hypothetical protein
VPAMPRHSTSARDCAEDASATGATPERMRFSKSAATETPPTTRGDARTASSLLLTQSSSRSALSPDAARASVARRSDLEGTREARNARGTRFVPRAGGGATRRACPQALRHDAGRHRASRSGDVGGLTRDTWIGHNLFTPGVDLGNASTLFFQIFFEVRASDPHKSRAVV